MIPHWQRSVGHQARDGVGDVGVVDGFAAMGAAVVDRVAGLGQHLADHVLERGAAVVRADGDGDALRSPA